MIEERILRDVNCTTGITMKDTAINSSTRSLHDDLVKENAMITSIGIIICNEIHGTNDLRDSTAPLLSLSSARLSP